MVQVQSFIKASYLAHPFPSTNSDARGVSKDSGNCSWRRAWRVLIIGAIPDGEQVIRQLD
jgi:hypothetical protein